MTQTNTGGAGTGSTGTGSAGINTASRVRDLLDPADTFTHRHIGPDAGETEAMLERVGAASMDGFIDSVVPESIRVREALKLSGSASRVRGEHELLHELREIAAHNEVYRSCIGMGYHGTVTPGVVLRNVLENPGWYTQYTPYQAELSQGRLEALLNFQTAIADLTGLPLANASLLDEATAAAEAMALCAAVGGAKRGRFLVADDCHPQTIAVVRTRADSMGLTVDVRASADLSGELEGDDVAGVLVQYPTTDGRIECYRSLSERAHEAGAMVVAAADLLALTLFTPPGEWGADICIGSAQRFGVPMGFGGPHAAFFSTHEKHARKMPGRIIGVSRDAEGRTALRLAIQTREQHIKRDRATSNICTAQVLLAIIAGAYAVYHGPTGLRRIAQRVRAMTQTLRAGLLGAGHQIGEDLVFDTLRVRPAGVDAQGVMARAQAKRINLRDFGDGSVGVTLDETTDRALLADLLECFGVDKLSDAAGVDSLAGLAKLDIPEAFERESGYLTHPVFNTHHAETEMLRYLRLLQNRDLSLAHSMIPLGSCTMKLNATSEMIPVTWPELGHLHPFAPAEQTRGYDKLFADLEDWLAEITGFEAVSLQPNAGSQGEYTGLLVIRAYHHSRGDAGRDVCLLPESAHGTNPASAVIAGMRVVSSKSTADGAIDVDDLRAKAEKHRDSLAALMVTYPSTCGTFEGAIAEICQTVHDNGGLVYMDGANMNAQVGLTSPGVCGADVCHLNLHKTFCIPHGGGGPGMGPIGVNAKLKPFLPGHPVRTPATAGERAVGAVSAAPYGSPSILPISWVYIALMGAAGLKRASEVAILSANYMAERLKDHYNVLFRGPNGRVAHEFVIDCRPFKKSAGIEIDDIAKRLIDFGFHAPTMSWPVPGTLMIEPTESESKGELDRYCDALIAIREEIAKVESGDWPKDDNPLKHAPHTISVVSADTWSPAYSRETAAWPAPWLRGDKFWPSVARVDNPFGDRNLMCSCPSVGELSES